MRAGRQILSFPLKYNYATSQVHYAFPFSLPLEIGPHTETQAQILGCDEPASIKSCMYKGSAGLMAASRTFWTLRELISHN